MTAANTGATSMPAASNAGRQFLDAYERECGTTLRLLRAYPDDKLDLRPAPKSKNAHELGFLFVVEQGMIERALTTGFDWSAPRTATPEPPPTMAAIAEAFDQGRARVVEIVRDLSDEQLAETVKFFVAPKTLGDVPKLQFITFMLHDQIHHRGQLSVYLRMADGKVPSIYGPTADEPWN